MTPIETTLTRSGLESISPADESYYPEIIREGERIWLTIVKDGVRVNALELSLFTVLKLGKQASAIGFDLAGR